MPCPTHTHTPHSRQSVKRITCWRIVLHLCLCNMIERASRHPIVTSVICRRYFCEAFPQVKRLIAPFWAYDCSARQLCPQWDLSQPCVPMEAPSGITTDQTLSSTSSGPSRDLVTASTPHQLLMLGEGGSGAAILSRLVAQSQRHLVWREVRSPARSFAFRVCL